MLNRLLLNRFLLNQLNLYRLVLNRLLLNRLLLNQLLLNRFLLDQLGQRLAEMLGPECIQHLSCSEALSPPKRTRIEQFNMSCGILCAVNGFKATGGWKTALEEVHA